MIKGVWRTARLGSQRAATPSNDIQSITKQFTAAAILKLEMIGKLRVTDPIGKFVGPVPEDKREITLHQLLTHTAGPIAACGGDYDRLSRAALVAGALESKLRSVPGTDYHYSNLGYGLLAAIIEKVSGMSYEAFMAEHLFGPVGMTQTGNVLLDEGLMVFWVINRYRAKDEGWNLSLLDPKLTQGVIDRIRDGS